MHEPTAPSKEPRSPGEVLKIRESMKSMAENFSKLTDWEREFYNSIRQRNPQYFSDKVLLKIDEAVRRLAK